ncbi:MAG TPA: carboxypeptidase regulatory-like domain-containing protein [Fulvivirga sp.]|nr:carboxypeptidase regulatory-like domain-containing protein [Fulvivirga sp.]
MKSVNSILVLLLTTIISYSQPCPSDVYVLEDENIEVWKVVQSNTTVFSLSTFQGTVSMNGSSYTQLPDNGGYGLIIAAHDISGSFLWAQQINNQGIFATNPTLMTNGTTVVAGFTEAQGLGTDQFFRFEAYDVATGVGTWSKSYAVPVAQSNLPFGAQVMPYDGQATSTGNYIVSGAFAGTMDINGTVLTTNGGLSESFVMALDPSGTDLWAIQSTGSNGRSRAWTLNIDPATDDVLIGGHFTGTITFGGQSFTAANTAIINPYLARLNELNGAAIWIVGMENGTANGFNNIYDITIDDIGNIYFTGNFNDNISILGNTITSQGATDVLVGSLASNGTYRWANQIGGVSTSDEFGTTINYSTSLSSVFVGMQLATDQVYYANNLQVLPPLSGHWLIGINTDGSIEVNPANAFSNENTFGYSAFYDDSRSVMVMADLIFGDGKNINIAQWIPNRPRPINYVTQENGILDPTDTLTAFDPGAGYTYQWYFNGSILPVDTLNTFTASTNGGYHLSVTNSNGCSVNSQVFFLLDGSTLESDSLALVELYQRTDGANWNNNTNWLVGNVSTWNGITVNGGRVTEIYLSGNNLNGELQASIGSLSALQSIDLSNNNIHGTLPANFWDITTLINVQLCCGNNISGSIPSNVGLLTNLTTLDLGGNSFTGNLPPELFNLSGLQFINLWDDGDNGMSLTGTIPSTIGNLTSLVSFSLSGNQITGPLPIELGNISTLSDLDLSNNPINDVAPSWSGLTSLISLGLSNCQLQGVFPDAIWQSPSLTGINIGNNPDLEIILPSNLASLTQFNDIRIDQTKPIGGPFPEALYSLTNLVGLSLGGQQFTGSLDSRVANWTQLDNIYIWNNQLEGDFPPEITAATNLQILYIAGNLFTSFPDLSTLSSLQELNISGNLLGFKDIVPNIGVPLSIFNYAPQKQFPNEYFQIDPGATETFMNDYTESGNVYDWIKNQISSGVTSANYDITNAQLSDLGGYFCLVTNPAAPDLTLQSKFYNIAFNGDPRSWTVDNSPESLADFKSFYAATYGTNDGDTLYVAGSVTPYNLGFSSFESPRYIFGPGYFLADNPETQAAPLTAQVAGIGFKIGASGSQVYGLDLQQLLINNQSSAIDDTVRNVHITGNRIQEFSINDDSQNILVNKNFINIFTLASTPAIGTSRSYQDIFVDNNIIDSVTTVFVKATAARNEMVNVNFTRNTINVFTDSIQDATLTNNIINNYLGTANAVSGTIGYAGASFADNALLVDNDFISTTNVDAGAFSGSDPYVLSGIPPIPHVFDLTNTGRIRLNVQAKNDAGQNINFINYKLGQGGNVVSTGTVKKLVVGNPVQVLFRPKLGSVTPNETYNLMLWAKDATGLKSVHQNLSFVAETTNASGLITTSANQPVNNGEVLLFEINQEGAAFDTLKTTLNSAGAFTFSNIVIGDYLALGKPNAGDFPTQLPTYYERIDLWEEADTLFIDTTNPSFNIKLLEKPKEETGVGMVAGVIEEELDQGNSGGRIEARERVRRVGVSMRRGRRTSRKEGIVYDLVSYVETNDNGEFSFEGLPPGDYRINIQYPGYPMDTLTNVDLSIEENKNNAYNLAALVDQGKISVTILSTTGLLNELVRNVSVYPNPAVENINIEFNKDINLSGMVGIDVISTKGELVYHQQFDSKAINQSNKISIPVSIYETGTYILQVRQANKIIGTIRIAIVK